ncbi:MAG: DUF1294 domain-containing protein [Clostridia bacterium]|nr:DUF1294 domain-containing protein [Clostridia bacterium]
MNNLFTVKNILIYLVIINLIAFLAMYIDKKRAKWGRWRIKESTLFTLVLLGGGIGGIAGMHTFRHKTKKMRFVIGFPLILIVEVVCTVIFICIN